MKYLKACIFDLDGVLTDTARYHYKAWRTIAHELDFDLTEDQNEQLKGVSRKDSLIKLLEWSNKKIDASTFDRFLAKKNEYYLELILEMNEADAFDGVPSFLEELKNQDIKIALGSSSKNAQPILEKLNLTHYFSAISDGNSVINSKPHPEVFLNAARDLNENPNDCVVFEDAQVGVDAAKAGGFKVIGIGLPNNLVGADAHMPNFEGFDLNKLRKML
jgi:beta-phosphoglucomutase